MSQLFDALQQNNLRQVSQLLQHGVPVDALSMAYAISHDMPDTVSYFMRMLSQSMVELLSSLRAAQLSEMMQNCSARVSGVLNQTNIAAINAHIKKSLIAEMRKNASVIAQSIRQLGIFNTLSQDINIKILRMTCDEKIDLVDTNAIYQNACDFMIRHANKPK